MEDTGRQRKNFVGYEYKEIIAESSRVLFLLDGYECFGWELEERLTENRESKNPLIRKKAVLHLKRNRKIINKVELTRLQRNFEACMKEIETLEKIQNVCCNDIRTCCGDYRHGVYGGFGICSDSAAAFLSFYQFFLLSPDLSVGLFLIFFIKKGSREADRKVGVVDRSKA